MLNLFGLQAPKVLGKTKVEAVEVNKMKLGEPDSSEEEDQKLNKVQNIKFQLI